ncbi:hypothetical protein [Streptomyces cinnamoneus]|uniref:hypothetical protein n=1 Tax=Streptomyces cinnamoneus TaxID=53446 RepID=UPI000CEEE2C5|nr:hypothetical protein [Streptomyces cinnamoneus]PPT14834.1 hypothetical protein CYQ11_19930 [Streptomyces cinnamoneus]
MSKYTDTVTLTDGTTLKIRIERGIAGTVFREVPSRQRPAGSLMRIGTAMHLVTRSHLTPIVPDRWASAADDAEGAEIALAFFTESAEACIEHASAEGIPVEQCYSIT